MRKLPQWCMPLPYAQALITPLFLTGALLFAAGCSGGDTGDDDSSSGPTPTMTPAETPPSEAQLTVSETSLEFGTVQAGATADQDLEVTNTGSSTLLLTVTLPVNPGSQYTVTSNAGPVPDQIEGGSTLALRVTFKPATNGDAPGTLRIDSTDRVNPRFDLPLSATAKGVQPDGDGDGYSVADGDCDDGDAAIHPDALEACDGVDNDCDGKIDEDGESTFYTDQDGDAHGDPATAFQACKPGTGAVTVGDDCDDGDSSVFPGALEQCDGLDNNCDSVVDENVTHPYFEDQDGDGYGNDTAPTMACTIPTGYATVGGDCDDKASEVYPQALEACDGVDNDCDGEIDEDGSTTFFQDRDGDGYGDPDTAFDACKPGDGAVTNGDDCDDASSSTWLGAPELCDGQDNDCDGKIDDGAGKTFYQDRDLDGYGDSGSTATGCSAPLGYVSLGGDCADNDAEIYPGADDVCDGLDNDCDGQVDGGVELTWYQDADGDNFGNRAVFELACTAPEGYIADATDCNDTDAASYPGAVEACDGKDNDCDGKTDEDGVSTFYRDLDQDGHGDKTVSQSACGAPTGYVSSSDDCNDQNKAVYPGASESCDGLDNDCDGKIDEEGTSTFYRDYDQDGHGDATTSQVGCNNPAGYVSSSDDCDDRDKNTYPGAAETCDGRDNNCNASIDEGVATTWYLDADRDSYGDPNTSTTSCTQPSLYVASAGDCNDLDKTVYPSATELCDGKDNNCDGKTDEGVLLTFYADTDQDGYGDATVPTSGCTAPKGSVADKTDCDDTRSNVYPGATETCDGLDDDCDGQIDEGVKTTFYGDKDGDGYGVSTSTIQACTAPSGYASSSTDCNDADKATHPGALEVCDGKDNNCDGSTDEGVKLNFYSDVDKDGYGDPASPVQACAISTGLANNNIDCKDSDATIYPGAAEFCDGKDNDCDTSIDEAGDSNQNLYYRDADNDGHGTTSPTLYACSAPSGYVSSKDDCNDGDAGTYPGAVEKCLGGDNNCDGVVAPPAPPVASNNGPICSGSSLNLSASTLAGATYAWSGPNSFVSTLQNPTISSATSAAAGTYSVTAKVSSCSTAAATTVVTITTASAAFTASSSTPYLNQAVTFTASQSGATYAWTFQGGSPATSTVQSPSVTWSVVGTYTVGLTVTLNGCSSSSSASYTVSDALPSCKAYKTANPAATDGVYIIDPDGSGPVAPFQNYCDMTTSGGGWMLVYYVDAAHFDGYIANNKVAQNTPFTAINSSGDVFNPPSSVTWTETMFACTQQNDAALSYWTYSKADPVVWFNNTTTDYNYQTIASVNTNSGNAANCIATHKAESSYGFMVLETGTSCGSCTNMLYGNYHYSSGSQCNSTDNTYGTHTSPYRSVTVGYPLCNKKQTSNGKLWIGIR